MINEYRFYILDVFGIEREINPINRDVFSISFFCGNYFDDEFTFSPNVNLSASELQIGYEDKKYFDEWFANELHLRNMPLKIFNDSLGIVISNFGETSLKMASAKQEPDQVIIEIIHDKTNFAELAQALNLQLIENQINRLRIQYINSFVPNYVVLPSLIIATYNLVMQIIAYVNKGVQLSLLTPPQPAAITAYVVEGVLLAAQMVLLYNQLSDALFEKIKCYAVAMIKELLEKACSYLGYIFQSSLFDGAFENLVILDRKSYKGRLITQNLAANDYASPNMSLYELMELVSRIFNAKAKIQGNVIKFEHISYFLQPSGVILPHVRNNENREYPFVKNAFELKKNFLFQFKTDPIETNTITKREGYIAQTQFAKDDLKGLVRKEINCAQAFHKDSTTILETLFNGLYDIISAFTSLTPINFNDRMNCLLVSADAIGEPKVFLWKDEKVNPQNLQIFNADFIRNQYSNLYPTNAQYEIIENYEVNLSSQEILAIMSNPVLQWHDGRVAFIDKEVQLLENGNVQLSVRISDTYIDTSEFLQENISY